MRVLGALGLLGLLMSGSARADGEEISRSRGRRGGVVVLWPRLVPETDDPELQGMAARLQTRAYAAAASVVDYRRVDVRPRPERSCPRQGCRGPSISLWLGHREGGCALVATLSGPGPAQRELLPLVGEVELERERIAHRAAPEDSILVKEFVPCSSLESRFGDEIVADAVRRLVVGKR